MSKQDQMEIQRIIDSISKEFPDDEALQQIHISRKLLMKEAEEKGMSYIQYLREQTKKLRESEKHDG